MNCHKQNSNKQQQLEPVIMQKAQQEQQKSQTCIKKYHKS